MNLPDGNFAVPLPRATLGQTGERMTAGHGGQVEIEHYHRYSVARDLAADLDVLDIASGDGYGAAMLATVARSVIGIELAEEAVAHAGAAYARPNLRFVRGDALSLPLSDASIDLVVSFETLEHFAEHDCFCSEVRRVLRPNGLFVVSTPDRIVYSAQGEAINQYHVRELTREEFAELLTRYFTNIEIMAQRAVIGSLLVDTRRTGSGWRNFERRGPFIEASNGLARAHYLVALASGAALPNVPWSSYVQTGRVDSVLRSAERTAALDEALAEEQRRADAEAARAEAQRQMAEDAARTAAEVLAEERRAQEQALRDVKDRLIELRAQRDQARMAADALAEERRAQEASLIELRAQREDALTRLFAIETSETWRATAPIRALGSRAPKAARFARRIAKALWWTATLQLPRRLAEHRRLIAGITGVAPTIRPPGDQFRTAILPVDPPAPLPENPTARPEPVDIIICVHNALEEVRRCLYSVQINTLPPYRLILVDDGSGEATRDFLADYARLHAAKLIRQERAKGYTVAANLGLRKSGAPYIVLLNSDTEVTDGWLDRMVDHLRRDETVGMVGPLSNIASWQSVPQVMQGDDWARNELPDGVTADDMAHIVAHGSSRRGVVVGFLNGFCLLIRRVMLDQIGLFDEATFGAGYGEENDLCIRARQGGWRLVVAEDAFVLHRQSQSYGNERRLELARRADAALAAKHDCSREIIPYVVRARNSLLLEHARQRVRAGLRCRRVMEEGREAFEGKRLGILLPIAEACGGGNVVLQEMNAARSFGVDSWIINLASCEASFRASYSGTDIPMLFAPDGDVVAFIRDAVRDLSLDGVVATAHNSFAWLPDLGTTPTRPRLGYYVQDLETEFYAPGSPEYQAAFATYIDRPEVRRFTKTLWNASAVRQLGGIMPTIVGPSVDLHRFMPGSDLGLDPATAVRVTAMVRPSTPRRNAAMTLNILRQLKDAFGERVSPSCFGASITELDLLPTPLHGIACFGRLRSEQVAAVLSETDLFLDFSTWQAMGLTALEAMASGAAVVMPQRGAGSEICKNESSGLLVDTANPAACFAAAKRLVEDAEFRLELRHAGMRRVADLLPEVAVLEMLRALFRG